MSEAIETKTESQCLHDIYDLNRQHGRKPGESHFAFISERYRELDAAREDGQIIENLYAALKSLVCCINTSASAKGTRFEGEQARVCAVLVKTCQYSDATNALESARDRLAQLQANRKA